MLGFLPGMSAEDIARREVDNYDLDPTGTKFDSTKQGAFNWQDQLGAILAGSSKEEILNRASRIRDQRLKDQLDKQGNEGRAILTAAGLTPTYSSVAGKTKEELRSQQGIDTARAARLQELSLMPGYYSGLVPENASLTQLNQITRQLKEAETKKAEDKVTAERRRIENRGDLQLAQQRLEAREARLDGLNFERMKFQTENNRLARAERREEERLRREGYQSLGTGLAALAAAFTIV
tara:strand:- start:736 stop:1446 length:711 start_codon:yes stop_codon:yes gene_type:complete